MKIELTVFMPVFNAGAYVESAIKSILNQSFTDFEFLIIDDCSTDDSETKILKFIDNRIRYIKNKKNIGVSCTANLGLDLARGKYIARMDADDIAHPERLKKQWNFMTANPDHVMVGSWYYLMTATGQVIDCIKRETSDEDIRLHMLLRNQFCQSSIMMRLEIAQKIRYNEFLSVCEDHDLWIRMLDEGKVANLKECLLWIRIHNTNTSKQKQETLKVNVFQLLKYQLTKYKIDFTAEELIVHLSISLQTASKYLISTDKLYILQQWLYKLKNALLISKLFGDQQVANFIQYIWMNIAVKNPGPQLQSKIGIKTDKKHFKLQQTSNIINAFFSAGTLSSLNRFVISSYLANGYVFHLYTYGDILNYPHGIELKDANKIISQKKILTDLNGNFFLLSDLFRYYLLYKIGGWCIDLNTISLSPFHPLKEDIVFASETLTDYKSGISNCIIKSSPGLPLFKDCIEALIVQNTQNSYSRGADDGLLGRMIYKHELQDAVKPPHVFCPVPQYHFEFITKDVHLELNNQTYTLHCYPNRFKGDKNWFENASKHSLLNRIKTTL